MEGAAVRAAAALEMVVVVVKALPQERTPLEGVGEDSEEGLEEGLEVETGED